MYCSLPIIKISVRTMVPLGRYFKGHDDLNPILFLLLTDDTGL